MSFGTPTVDASGFDSTNHDADVWITQGAARGGSLGAAANEQESPNFHCEVVVTTDTSDGTMLDLTAQGVTFPAGSRRTIRCQSLCSSVDSSYYYEWEEDVLGGTTPKLLGQRMLNGWNNQAGTVFATGRVHFAATITALTTITTIYASKGWEACVGDIASGTCALLVPKNAYILNKGCTLDGSVVSVTAAGVQIGVVYTNLDGLGTGTGGLVFYEQFTGTDVLTDDPKLATRLDLAFEVWPPINHRLVLSTNNVTVKCTATNANIGADALRHTIDVFVGKLRRFASPAA